MANQSLSLCFPPFLSIDDFPYTGGLESSRLCTALSDSVTCCLPCPMTDWVYPDNYLQVANAANWVAVGSVVCCLFLLISFLVLPVQKTSRHYLTICLVSGVGLCCLSFVVALGAQPEQCHDSITPNDMRSDLACAFSGALVVFGGFAAVMWVFLRSLSVCLQICFQIVPGRKFFYCSLLAGWGLPTLFLGLSLGLSGVSYRFGNICHINHEYSLGTFWGPLLAFAALAGIIQFATLGYCIRVYLRSVMDAGSTSANSSNMQSFAGSTKTVSAKAAYRRVRKVVSLQWRGIMVIMIVLFSVIYFAVVFIKLDTMTARELENPTAVLPWLRCIVLHGGDKNKCLDEAGGIILSEPIVMAVLFLIASFGYWCALFLGRVSMLTAWFDLFKRPFSRSRDFISVDARRMSDPRNYEMLTSPPQKFYMSKGPDGLYATTTEASPETPVVRDFSPPPQNHAQATRAERSESFNFSHPRPLERTASRNNRVTFSREGPASSPIKEWPTTSPVTPDVQEHTTFMGAHSPTLPTVQQRTAAERPAYGRTDSSASRERSSSALGREWNAPRGFSSQSPRASPIPHRSNSQMSRDWDPRSTYAPAARALSPGGSSYMGRNGNGGYV